MARYNTAPQRPRGLSRRNIEPLHRRSDANHSVQQVNALKTKSSNDFNASQSHVEAHDDQEPKDTSSSDSSEDENETARVNTAAQDALEVRRFQESQNSRKRKRDEQSQVQVLVHEDEADNRISSWSSQPSQRRITSKHKYGAARSGVVSAGATNKGKVKAPGFKNIHAKEEASVEPEKSKGVGLKRGLRMPFASDAPAEISKNIARPSFKLPQGADPSLQACESENSSRRETNGRASRNKQARQLNMPQNIKDLVTNGNLEDISQEIKSKRKMRLPSASAINDTSLTRAIVPANEVIEGSTSSSRSRANSVAVSDSSMSDVEEVENPDPIKIVEKVQCPMCSKHLLKATWDVWKARNPHMTLKDKQRFCREHTRGDAQETWRERGYPKIEWGDAFDQRLERHRPFLDDLLQDSAQSFFRTQFEGVVDRGESRTIQKRGNEGHKSTLGYYGLKGLEHISAFISYEYAAKLRELAVTDAVIAARDQSGYINMVLVPELISRLIMEDMHVDVAGARDIMEESHVLGDLLCGVDGGSHRIR